MRNIKLTIEYDGKDWGGWQKQPNKLNIQGEIERAIELVTGEKVELIASGRTVEQICEEIGADSLGYLETDKLSEMICNQTGFCDACFTGNYPIEPPTIDIRGEMG